MSFKNYKRAIVLDFNYEEVKKGVPDVNRQMGLLNAEFRKTSEQVNLTGNSMDKLGITQQKLSLQLQLQGDKVGILRDQLAKLNDAENRNEKAIASKTIELKNAEAQYSKIQGEIVKTNAQLEKQKTTLGLTEKQWKNFGDKATAAGKTMSMYVTAPILAAGGASFKLASDMNETLSKVDVAFKGNAESVKAWAKDSLQVMGLAKMTALDTAAGFQAMSNGMGIAITKATEMSKETTRLTADLSSYFNTSQAMANTALTGIWTGEGEALKKYGVIMTQANLQQYAYSKGIRTKIQDMKQSEQVMLRYNYVMDKTKDAQGDFARTSDSASNQLKVFKESMKELGETFGQEILPIVTPFITFLNDVIQKLAGMNDGTKALIVGVASFLAIIGPILLIVGKIATTISNVGTAMKTLSTVGDLFNKTAGNATFLTFAKWAAIIIAVVAAVTALVIAINYLTGKGKEMNGAIDQISGAMGNTQKRMNVNRQQAMSAGYATGTNYVKKSGVYRVGEYGPEDVYLERGGSVKSAERTRSDSQPTDMNETNSLLRNLIGEFSEMKQAYKDQPRDNLRFAREGVVY